MKRTEFGLWAATAIAVVALPSRAFAQFSSMGPVDPDGDPSIVKSTGTVNSEAPLAPTVTTLTHSRTFNFSSDAVAEDKWATKWPQNVTVVFLIDYMGNYLFTGTIPPQPKMKYDNATAFGFGLKSSALDNQTIAFVKKVKVTKAGGAWSHQGHDPIIADLWKGVVKGHKWTSASHTIELFPPKPKAAPKPASGGGASSQNGQQSSGGSGGSGGLIGDVTSGVSDVGGALERAGSDVVSSIGNTLGGAVSDVLSFL